MACTSLLSISRTRASTLHIHRFLSTSSHVRASACESLQKVVAALMTERSGLRSLDQASKLTEETVKCSSNNTQRNFSCRTHMCLYVSVALPGFVRSNYSSGCNWHKNTRKKQISDPEKGLLFLFTLSKIIVLRLPEKGCKTCSFLCPARKTES